MWRKPNPLVSLEWRQDAQAGLFGRRKASTAGNVVQIYKDHSRFCMVSITCCGAILQR